MSSPAKDAETTKRFIAQCMEECRAMKEKHDQLPAAAYNNDVAYRGLVTELLDAKNQALAKMDHLLACHKDLEKNYAAKPMRMCFRDHMGGLVQKLNITPDTKEALRLCKLFGLLVHGVAERNELGEPPLITAIADGVTDDKLELLLQAGCDVNESMDYPGVLRKGMTPMLTASLYGRTSMLCILAGRGGDVAAANSTGGCCVSFAACYGHVTTVEALGRLGADLNKADDTGSTPLFMAAQNGHVSVVEALGRLGADLNMAADTGVTPLWFAAQEGHAPTVQALLRLGADPTIAWRGRTPMDVAVSEQHVSVVEVFSAAKIEPTTHKR